MEFRNFSCCRIRFKSGAHRVNRPVARRDADAQEQDDVSVLPALSTPRPLALFASVFILKRLVHFSPSSTSLVLCSSRLDYLPFPHSCLCPLFFSFSPVFSLVLALLSSSLEAYAESTTTNPLNFNPAEIEPPQTSDGYPSHQTIDFTEEFQLNFGPLYIISFASDYPSFCAFPYLYIRTVTMERDSATRLPLLITYSRWMSK